MLYPKYLTILSVQGDVVVRVFRKGLGLNPKVCVTLCLPDRLWDSLWGILF
jgi:hypothetical protein